ncbi:hypothetical protein Sjap_009100 [Stephania japonica]|uniref:Protein TIC 22-like, chloroplastic n=1 Tax=Stephania japonica TaxID=461633 RepID=A0AAP0PF42_9MAGN
MDFLQWKNNNNNNNKPPNINLHQTLAKIQTQCTDFLQTLSKPLHHHRQTLETLICHAKTTLSSLNCPSIPIQNQGLWARIGAPQPQHRFDIALSFDAIEERLAGVGVYVLSNSADEFVLVSGVPSKKTLGLICFAREDAQTMLDHMRSVSKGMGPKSMVVKIALDKVIQLKLEGVSFRMIPEPAQVQNALKVKEQAGLSNDEGFFGVPVFQSQSLFLKAEDKRYRPYFFRKEDLENSLKRAAEQQKQLNPAFRQGDIQVATFEEVLKGMKGKSTSKWDDVVFIPPGFDVTAGLPQNKANG